MSQNTDKEQKKADIVAVAKAAKVSISTVSRSFNHPDLVKPATRKRIDSAVRRLGYIRNRAAQAMHGIRNGTIGLVVPTIDHAIFAEVVQAFSDSVDAHGFTILLATHGYDLEREYAVLRKFLEHRVDGIALIGFDHSSETYDLLDRQGIPVVSLWNFDTASRLSCVGSDNVQAGHLAAQHVVDLGHRAIATMFPPTDDNDRARGRFRGVQDHLSDNFIIVPGHWSLQATYKIADAKRVAIDLLQKPDRPTAIICGNDVLALGAIYGAQHCGLRVPQDISIIGIGDFAGSKETEPALTTVHIPARMIGQLGGERIVTHITAPSAKLTRTECTVELLPRESCIRIAT